MFIYCYDDTLGWGAALLEQANKLGVPAKIFSDANSVTDGSYVFMHLIHHPFERRNHDKEVAIEVSKRRVKLIPTIEECMLYDDKWAFYKKFPDWIPATYLLSSYDNAMAISQQLPYPIISKSSEGAASSNVRMLASQAHAQQEIDAVFKSSGIGQYGGATQKNYLIWQEFCAGNAYDWRIIIIAQKYCYVLKRYNRPDMPFASGSGILEPIKELNDEIIGLLKYVMKFCVDNRYSFVGTDVVYDKDHQPKLLEITAGWDINGYKNCMVYEYIGGQFIPTGKDGKDDLFHIIVIGIINGAFQ